MSSHSLQDLRADTGSCIEMNTTGSNLDGVYIEMTARRILLDYIGVLLGPILIFSPGGASFPSNNRCCHASSIFSWAVRPLLLTSHMGCSIAERAERALRS